MTPVFQNKFSDLSDEDGVGNCLQAVIASILDLPLEAVPHFVQDDILSDGELHWWTQLRRFVREHGCRIYYDTPMQNEYYLRTGNSPRGFPHVVIYCNNALVHDPHPEGGGLVVERDTWVVRKCEREHGRVR